MVTRILIRVRPGSKSEHEIHVLTLIFNRKLVNITCTHAHFYFQAIRQELSDLGARVHSPERKRQRLFLEYIARLYYYFFFKSTIVDSKVQELRMNLESTIK